MVRGPMYKDVRGTQEEQDAKAELERGRTLVTEPSGPTKGVSLLSNVQSARASTGQPGWPADAPWWEKNYVHPDNRTVLVPEVGRAFHDNVPRRQRIVVGRDRTDYRGQTYSKNRMDDASHALIKCIRHSMLLPSNAQGWCYLTDVTFVLWKCHRNY